MPDNKTPESQYPGGQDLSPDDLEETLGIKGINPGHLPALARLANKWKLQADIGGLNEESVSYIKHAMSVRATALMPSLNLKESDPEQFKILSELSQLARAEEAVVDWAFKDKFTIDAKVVDVPKKIS